MSGLGILGEARWEQSTKGQEEQGAVCMLGKLRHGAGAVWFHVGSVLTLKVVVQDVQGGKLLWWRESSLSVESN